MFSKVSLAVLAMAMLTLTSSPVAEFADARDEIHCVRECDGPLPGLELPNARDPPCIYGSDSDCKIKHTCVMAPCYPERVP